MILTLSAILFVLLSVIGRAKGIKTFCSVYINFSMGASVWKTASMNS